MHRRTCDCHILNECHTFPRANKTADRPPSIFSIPACEEFCASVIDTDVSYLQQCNMCPSVELCDVQSGTHHTTITLCGPPCNYCATITWLPCQADITQPSQCVVFHHATWNAVGNHYMAVMLSSVPMPGAHLIAIAHVTPLDDAHLPAHPRQHMGQ